MVVKKLLIQKTPSRVVCLSAEAMVISLSPQPCSIFCAHLGWGNPSSCRTVALSLSFVTQLTRFGNDHIWLPGMKQRSSKAYASPKVVAMWSQAVLPVVKRIDFLCVSFEKSFLGRNSKRKLYLL